MKTQAPHARGLHNWAKECLLTQLVRPGCDSIAELYCGPAALDLGKYDRARVTQYVAVDPSPDNLSRTEKALRLKGLSLEANFLKADPTEPNFASLLSEQVGPAGVSHVTCFSGLHQRDRFTTERQAVQLMRNVHTCLQPGGFFFGIVPDSGIIWSRTQGADLDSRQGELYSLRCTQNHAGETGADGRQFGTMDFQLKIGGETEAIEGCLVHFPTFQRVAEEVGFRVWEIINLVEFYHMHKLRHRKQLVAYQAITEKNPSLEKHNGDVAAFFALFILQKKPARELTLEKSQEGMLQADDWEPDWPHYCLAANASRKPP